VRRLDCPGSDDDTKGHVHVHQTYRYADRHAERRRAARRPMPSRSSNSEGQRDAEARDETDWAGLAKEIKAKPGAPVWRRDEQADQPYALKLTAAGAKTFAIDDGSASNETREDISQHLQGAAPKFTVS
jgi:hypothetical protein